MLYPAVFIVLLLPWLNPFAPGPSAAVGPLLFSWACGLAFLGLWAARPSGARLVAVAALAWLAAGVLNSSFGVLQYFNLASVLAPWVDVTLPGEAFGNLRQRNQFATLTNMALAALCWVALNLARRGVPLAHPPEPGSALAGRGSVLGQRFSAASVWTCVLAALLAVGNAASSSRTGLLQLGLLAVLVLWWGGWRQAAVRRVLVAAVLAYAVALWALPWALGQDAGSHGLFVRLRGGEQGCSSRRILWANVLELVAQKPLLGWGWGELDFAHYIHAYAGARFCEILDNAHNLPLHLAVELGLPVALTCCAALGWWLLRQRPWQERHPTRQLAWAVLAIIGLHSLLEYPLWYGPFQLAVLLCVGLLWRSPTGAVAQKSAKNGPNRGVAAVFIACTATIFIAVVSYAGWDYRGVSQIYLDAAERDPAWREGTLSKVSGTWLFQNQYRFALLSLTPLTPANARWTYDTATALLHYAPEPRVVEKVIESATLLGLDEAAVLHLARFKAAFAADYARWVQANANAGKKAP